MNQIAYAMNGQLFLKRHDKSAHMHGFVVHPTTIMPVGTWTVARFGIREKVKEIMKEIRRAPRAAHPHGVVCRL